MSNASTFPQPAPSWTKIPRPWQRPRRLWVALCALGLGGPALAEDLPAGEPVRWLYAEAGVAKGGTWTTSVGLNLPWAFERRWWGGHLTGHWDAYISHWNARNANPDGARESWTQLAVVPTVRFRFDQGRSPWFIEGGIGLSVLDSQYRTHRKLFSTRFNFSDHQALGRNFGDRRQHELLLILRHVSNAGIEKPNPGENFLQLRYSIAF